MFLVQSGAACKIKPNGEPIIYKQTEQCYNHKHKRSSHPQSSWPPLWGQYQFWDVRGASYLLHQQPGGRLVTETEKKKSMIYVHICFLVVLGDPQRGHTPQVENHWSRSWYLVLSLLGGYSVPWFLFPFWIFQEHESFWVLPGRGFSLYLTVVATGGCR